MQCASNKSCVGARLWYLEVFQASKAVLGLRDAIVAVVGFQNGVAFCPREAGQGPAGSDAWNTVRNAVLVLGVFLQLLNVELLHLRQLFAMCVKGLQFGIAWGGRVRHSAGRCSAGVLGPGAYPPGRTRWLPLGEGLALGIASGLRPDPPFDGNTSTILLPPGMRMQNTPQRHLYCALRCFREGYSSARSMVDLASRTMVRAILPAAAPAQLDGLSTTSAHLPPVSFAQIRWRGRQSKTLCCSFAPTSLCPHCLGSSPALIVLAKRVYVSVSR